MAISSDEIENPKIVLLQINKDLLWSLGNEHMKLFSSIHVHLVPIKLFRPLFSLHDRLVMSLKKRPLGSFISTSRTSTRSIYVISIFHIYDCFETT